MFPFSSLTDPSYKALIHIHEPAQFVGHPELIDDHAYNFQGNKLENFPAVLKMLNAENYMNFAWEVKRGTEPPAI